MPHKRLLDFLFCDEFFWLPDERDYMIYIHTYDDDDDDDEYKFATNPLPLSAPPYVP